MGGLYDFLSTEASNLEQAGLLRKALPLGSPQGASITIGNKELLNLASSDYLGLSGHAAVKKAAKAALDTWGWGLASPPMITGALPLHTELETALARFLGTEEALLYASGYHANTGLFESLFGDRDFLFCDEQIHPSLADGIRLSHARVYSYRNNDMDHLEDRLKRSRSARFRAIVTDGVFPLEGTLANLAKICDLAAKYDAVVVVDDAQGIGVLGDSGRGTAERLGMASKVDIVTGSFGNALGGGAGGFVAARSSVVNWLRQKSRPHIVSTALGPAAAAAALAALEIVATDTRTQESLRERITMFRDGLTEAGYRLIQSEHPIVTLLIGDAVPTQRLADLLYTKGLFVMGFCHPVVPEGSARIRVQVSAAHQKKQLDAAVETFAAAGKELKLL